MKVDKNHELQLIIGLKEWVIKMLIKKDINMEIFQL